MSGHSEFGTRGRKPASAISRERLVSALHITAGIVAQPGGEVYAPIFERLELELAEVDRHQSVVARARALAIAAFNPIPAPSIRPDAAEWDQSRN